MPLPDWNHNGKRDAFDAFVDMKIIEEVNKAENDKKNSADTTTDCSSNYIEYNTLYLNSLVS